MQNVTIQFLTNLVEHHQALAYTVIFLGLVIEGEFFLIFTGIMAHLGAINLWVAFLFALAGVFGKTFFGYALGKYLFKKFNHNKFFKYIRKRVYHFLPHFKQRPFWSIFVSKFIMGANNVTIIFSGFEKVSYRKFLRAETISNFIWTPAVLSLGYVFSYTALKVSHEIWRFSLIVLVFIILFIIFDRVISWAYGLFEEFYSNEIEE
ncbi:MAG TPA: DedA family protein [Candidatus Paceibacterota bacterium]